MISTRRASRSYVFIPSNFLGLSCSRIATLSSRGGSHPGSDLPDCALAGERARSVTKNESIRPDDVNIANSLGSPVIALPATFYLKKLEGVIVRSKVVAMNSICVSDSFVFRLQSGIVLIAGRSKEVNAHSRQFRRWKPRLESRIGFQSRFFSGVEKDG